MSNTSFQIKSATAPRHRSAHDLSHHVTYTSKCGEILPIFQRFMLPNQRIKGKVTAFCRTQPLLAPAFTPIRQYFEFYAVPIRLLWRFSPQFFANLGEQPTSAFSVMQPFKVSTEYSPYLTVGDIVKYLNAQLVGFRHGSYVPPSNTPGSFVNQFGFNRGMLSAKLLSYLGYDFCSNIQNDGETSAFHIAAVSDNDSRKALNIWPLLAYQCVCQHFHRFTQWENSKSNLYNLDYIPSSVTAGQESYHIPLLPITPSPSVSSPINFFDLQYCNLSKDYFFGQYPTSQFGADATAPLTGVSPNQSLSILALRFAQAQQRIREIQLTNKQDFVSQMSALFDAHPNSLLSSIPIRVASFHQDINVSPIFNQNLSADFDQADPRGLSSGEGDVYLDYTSQEPCILIGIQFIRPLAEYANDGVDPHLLKVTQDSYANPVFDQLGLERLPMETLTLRESMGRPENLGFTTRYAEYKCAISRVLGDFNIPNGGTRVGWNAPLKLRLYWDKSLSQFKLTYLSFKCDPRMLDDLFAVKANDSDATDEFNCSVNFDFNTIIPLSDSSFNY